MPYGYTEQQWSKLSPGRREYIEGYYTWQRQEEKERAAWMAENRRVSEQGYSDGYAGSPFNPPGGDQNWRYTHSYNYGQQVAARERNSSSRVWVVPPQKRTTGPHDGHWEMQDYFDERAYTMFGEDDEEEALAPL